MKIFKWFDKFEDKTRHRLSRWPILYAFIGGVGIVLFWRGVWHLADQFEFMTPIVSIALSTALLLVTGTFVSFFIGGRILLSGLMQEKRIDEKTADEIVAEEVEINEVKNAMIEIRKDISDIKQKLK